MVGFVYQLASCEAMSYVPAPGMALILQCYGGALYNATTNAAGYFEFDLPPEACYCPESWVLAIMSVPPCGGTWNPPTVALPTNPLPGFPDCQFAYYYFYEEPPMM